MELKAGSRLKSAVCETEVIVVRSGPGPIDIRCGGHPMVSQTDGVVPDARIVPGLDEGSLLGKRYASNDAGLELLVTKGGAGTLTLADEPLPLKDAKPLPSSD